MFYLLLLLLLYFFFTYTSYEVPVSGRDDSSTIVLPVYMREKKTSNSYNGYPRVAQQIFGQPLLVAVPRHNCTYKMLYNCVLDKMVYVEAVGVVSIRENLVMVRLVLALCVLVNKAMYVG